MHDRTFRQRVLFPAGVLALAAGMVMVSFALEPATVEGGDIAAAPSEKYQFGDVTQAAGVFDVGRTWGSSWVDFEDDGDPDLFLVRHWREPILFFNEGGEFVAMRTPRSLRGTQMDRHQCTWGEANYDRLPDLLCTQGADNGQGEGPNQLLLNTGDGLRDRARQFRIQYAKARGRTVNWVDYDGDGDLDAFLGTTQRPRFPMELFKRGPDNFRKARVGLSHELSVLTSTWADWDRDGDADLLVTQHYPYVTVAYENVRGKKFRPVHLPRLTGKQWLSANWGDFDGDGWIDLLVTGRKKLKIYRNKKGLLRPKYKTRLRQGRSATWFDVDNDGDLDSFVVQGARGNREGDDSVNWRDFLVIRTKGDFERVEAESVRGPTSGNGEQATIADFDRDGRLDVFVTNGLHYYEGQTVLLQNHTAAGNWGGIDLHGSRKNPLGYGAVVKWKLGDLVLRRQLTDNVTFKGQSEVGYVHLGLRDLSVAEVKVKWPDGDVDCTTLETGRVVTVKKGNLGCP